MGSSGRVVVGIVLASTAVAQIRSHPSARATANLDAIAREAPGERIAHDERIVHRPKQSPPRPANDGAATPWVAAHSAEVESGYTIYSGFLAILDPYARTPPDTGGAVGPKHVVTMLNSQVLIQSRTGEARPGYPIELDRFWSGLGEISDAFDPRFQYDQESDRWIASAGVDEGSKRAALLLGVSRTGDPGGAWNLYRIDVGSTGYWADYPVLGFNENWIVISANLFRLPPQGAYDRTQLFVFNKAELYQNADDSYVAFADDRGALSPVRDYDHRKDTMYFAQAFGGDVGTIRISVLSGAPGDERFVAGANEISIADSWSETSPYSDDFAPQLNSNAKVDTGDSRLQNCVLRTGTIWCAHTVFLPADAPDRAAVQWFQVDPEASLPLQFGRIEQGGGNFYAFPSIAVNRYSDALIGYSRFSRSGYPEAGFAVRAATDPPNGMTRRTVYKRGEAPYVAIGYDEGSNRWGDYSAAMVDPVDDLTFWTIQEYAAAPTDGYLGRWGTWWARVVAPSAGMNCTYTVAPPDAAFNRSGGVGRITVETQPGCPWMAAGDAGWIEIRSGSSSVGSGALEFSVAANTRATDLKGTVTIAGQAIAVSVSAAR